MDETANANPAQDLSHVARSIHSDMRQQPGSAYWRFRLNYPDGSNFEVRTLPEATVAEAVLLWPGATIEPLTDDLEGNNT